MIVVVGGFKGGVGKTILSTNLVVFHSLVTKKNILFIDADEILGSSDWINQRQGFGHKINWNNKKMYGKDVYKDLQKISKEYDDIIIDVGGGDTPTQRSCIAIADLYLLPFRPRTPDLWTLDKIQDMILSIKPHNKKLRCLPCINQGDTIGKDNRDSLEYIRSYQFLYSSDIVINQRKSFHNAFAQGLSVIELKKRDAKACKELEYLYSNIYI